MARSGHSPLYPDYRRAEFPNRNLLMLEGKNLYDEHEKLVTLDDAQHLYREVFRQNGMVYCRSFASQEIFPWLDTFIRSSHCSVLCNKKGKPLALLLRKGNHRRWIVLFKTWEMKPDMHSVHILRQAFDHIDAGVAPTPGGLGRNIMRQVWHQYRLPVHTSPSGHCEQYIREHMCGGRVDTPGLGNFYPELLEVDMYFGYIANHYCQATDAPVVFTRGEVYGLADFFALCIVYIHSDLALGPFPVRVHSHDEERVVYPTLSGAYQCYLWKGQVDDARRAGCTVKVVEGYGWRRMTDNTGYLAERLFDLRDTAPTKEVENVVKHCGVAFTGGLGMSGTFYTLIPEEKAGPKDLIPLVNARTKEPMAYYVHEEERPYLPNMVHWFSRTITETARSLYRFALPFAQDGRLVATNYDSVLVVEKNNEGRRYIKKYTSEEIHPRPGDWRATHLHNCFIVAPRSIECDEKSIRPGVMKEGRVKYDGTEQDNRQFRGLYRRRGEKILERV